MNAGAALTLYVMAAVTVAAIVLAVVPLPASARRLPEAIGIAGIVATLAITVTQWSERQVAFNGELRIDRFGLLMTWVIMIAALATLLLGWGEPAAAGRRREFTGLVLAAATGMMLTVMSGDLITLFIGIELLSVSLYILCAMEVARERSLESGLKYLITGSIGTALLVYGFALLYGVTGTTSLAGIATRLDSVGGLASDPLLIAAIVLIVVALGFKASAVPFHMWTPDVYQGAPTPVTAFMGTGTKAAAMGAFLLLFTGATSQASGDWRGLIGALAVATMVVGNVGALLQDNVKRMLAWSSIAQAGYLLIGVAVGTTAGAEALIYYLFAYVAMTLAAFAIVILREREVEDGDQLTAMAGVVMTLAMVSLAGFPPFAGFVGKFLLFGSAVDAGMTWLAIVGAVASVISVVYYLRVVIVMWGPPADDRSTVRRLRVPPAVAAVAVTGAVAIVGLAIAAQPMLDVCADAARALIIP
ncbi:MAG: NADH-quinone oxidoreductase subunit N [Miltoncostaeaceae bacterium]